MGDKAFVVMQVGARDSVERKRANEVYEYIVRPALSQFDLEPYRADLDPSPGAITPKILAELVEARLVIADLSGRNPNVFYELGIAHAFLRPLISIADSVRTLPFDAKDERVIELGEYPESGLAYAAGESAKAALVESLRIVLAADYEPPSPLREMAAERSLDALAPDNPIAAEMAQVRETLDEIRENLIPRQTVENILKHVTPRPFIPPAIKADLVALRAVVERNIGAVDGTEIDMLTADDLSTEQRAWAADFRERWREQNSTRSSDPWGSAPTQPRTGGFSDEPPF